MSDLITIKNYLATATTNIANATKLVNKLIGITPAPTNVITDRLVRLKPTPPTLGAAGTSFIDPTFGSKIWRVTDAGSNEGAACHTPSSIGGAWNSDGTKFILTGAGGNAMFFGFDGAKITQLASTIRNQSEPWFSYVDPNLIYANSYNPTTSSYRLIKSWNLLTGLESIVADLDALYGNIGLANGGYVGPVVITDNDVLVVLFGGYGQDSHFLIHHSKLGLIDARGLTVQSTAGTVLGFRLHGIGVDRLGRLLLNPSGADITAHPGIAQIQVYDPISKSVTPLTDSMKGGGHYQLGYNQMVNQDCCTQGTWDSAQWQIRSLDALGVTKDLISPVLTPKVTTLSDHTSWRNARADKAMPILSSTFRTSVPATEPWRAWDDEIITIATDGSGEVRRHCHHQAIVTNDYWTQPDAHIDPTGRYAIFTSNWGNTVGANRQDVFLVQLV